MSCRRPCSLALLLAALLALPIAPSAASAADSARGRSGPGSYTNPLRPRVAGDGVVESCADPHVAKGRAGDPYWYLYCTTDPLNDDDLDAAGNLVFHRVPTSRSRDLVHWEYVGDAFPAGPDGLPGWAADDAALWAPDVVYSTTFHRWYLFTVVTETDLGTDAAGAACPGDNAVGVAVGDSPTGPWTWSDVPVVGPRHNTPGCDFFWTFDPDVLGDAVATSSVLYYGSYYGGIFGTRLTLTATGADADPAATRVTIDNRYEGANVVRHRGWYYLFASATNCCNGALTGYSVFAGRSRTPLGPYLDREGSSLLDPRVGGTPVLSMNGNRWVGPGHNTVFRDAAGGWWTIYHAVDQADPYFATSPGFTKRPPLLDAVDWVDGWPTVNGGRWASDHAVPAPAAQPGQPSGHRLRPVTPQRPGRLLDADGFGSGLDGRWSWVREPAAGTYRVAGGVLRMDIQKAELYVDTNTASVLVRPAPHGDYVVDTKVRVSVPDEGCCFNYAQAGLLVYGDDDNFVKLTNTAIWDTRQTEWAKEVAPVPAGWARYGNSVVGPPGEGWTYLRLVVERLHGGRRAAAGADTEAYTAYTSQDGAHWVRGGTWTHSLGRDARIGLVAMGQQGDVSGTYAAEFDYVRVHALRGR